MAAVVVIDDEQKPTEVKLFQLQGLRQSPGTNRSLERDKLDLVSCSVSGFSLPTFYPIFHICQHFLSFSLCN